MDRANGQVVGVYARLSKLKGRDDSIETQVELSTAEARRLWPGCSTAVYKDPDVSAADPTKVRPDFLRLVSDVAAGRVTQVVASDQERITRQPAEWETLIQVLRAAGIDATYGYRDGRTGVQLGETAAGRYKVVGAAEYVEGIKVKVREKLQKNADRGQPSGGRFYGYERVTIDGVKTLKVKPDEAAIVRRILADVRAGKTLRSVAQWLYTEGVKAPKGGDRWAITSIRNLVTSPHLAGLLTHRGQVVGPGNWEGLITPAERDDLVALFAGRTLKSPRHGARKYLLSGLPFCPDCEERMGGGGNHHEYRCRFCGRSVAAEKTERYVVGLLLPRIDALNELLGLSDADHGQRRGELLAGLARIERQRETYGVMLADEEMDPPTYQAARRRLAEQEQALRTELAGLPSPVTQLPTSSAARQGFAGLDLPEQRALIEQYVEKIVVRATKARRWSPDRLTVLTRVPVESEAAQKLLTGRRAYVERTSGPAPDLAVALRFLELADVNPTPEDEAAYLSEVFEGTQEWIDAEGLTTSAT